MYLLESLWMADYDYIHWIHFKEKDLNPSRSLEHWTENKEKMHKLEMRSRISIYSPLIVVHLPFLLLSCDSQLWLRTSNSPWERSVWLTSPLQWLFTDAHLSASCNINKADHRIQTWIISPQDLIWWAAAGHFLLSLPVQPLLELLWCSLLVPLCALYKRVSWTFLLHLTPTTIFYPPTQGKKGRGL